MTDSAVLDTVLGLLFIFYALALLCSGLVEMIANWVKKRAKYLLQGIRELLADVATDVDVENKRRWERMQKDAPDLLVNGMLERRRYQTMLHAETPTAPGDSAASATGSTGTTLYPVEQPKHRNKLTLRDVMGHPLVQPFRHATSLGKPTRNPSYLPSGVFARALIDLLTPGKMEPSLAAIETGVRALEHSPDLQQSLTSIVKAAQGDIDAFVSGLQVWFDRQMDRVTGSYKRWAKRWVIIIAIVVVCAFNIDSIAIARALYASSAIRAAVVQQAGDQNFCSTPTDQATCAVQAKNLLEATNIPLGWSASNPQGGAWGWLLKALGLLISVGAAALGAPFWYRFLDRVGTLRNTGRSPAPGS
jgi:hypothetical protein